MPGDPESTEGILLDGFDLAAKARKRSSAKRAQNPRVDPFGPGLARTELPLHDRPGLGEPAKRRDDGRLRETESPSRVAREERAVGARVPP